MPDFYVFQIENKSYHWSQRFITGAEVKRLMPHAAPSVRLFVKGNSSGTPGIPVSNEDRIDLAVPVIRQFYARRRTIDLDMD